MPKYLRRAPRGPKRKTTWRYAQVETTWTGIGAAVTRTIVLLDSSLEPSIVGHTIVRIVGTIGLAAQAGNVDFVGHAGIYMRHDDNSLVPNTTLDAEYGVWMWWQAFPALRGPAVGDYSAVQLAVRTVDIRVKRVIKEERDDLAVALVSPAAFQSVVNLRVLTMAP